VIVNGLKKCCTAHAMGETDDVCCRMTMKTMGKLGVREEDEGTAYEDGNSDSAW
jgi:hypothetical protein